MTAFRLDRRHESDRGEIVLCATLPAFGETPIADQPVILRRKKWVGGNRRVEEFGLFGLDICLRMGGGFRSSAIKAEALRNDGGVEEGQGELVVFHGGAREKRVRARAPAHDCSGLSSRREG